MLKLIAILTSCCLTLAVTVHAAEQADQENAKKPSQKPKNVQKQQFTPKQQQVKTPNVHVEKVHTDRSLQTDVSRKHIEKTPVVQSNTLPAVQSTKTHKNKEQFQTNNQQQLQTNTNQQFKKNKLDKQAV